MSVVPLVPDVLVPEVLEELVPEVPVLVDLVVVVAVVPEVPVLVDLVVPVDLLLPLLLEDLLVDLDLQLLLVHLDLDLLGLLLPVITVPDVPESVSVSSPSLSDPPLESLFLNLYPYLQKRLSRLCSKGPTD